MSAYETLALSYDELTTDVDYPGLLRYLEAVCGQMQVSPKRVLDLACGTGSMSVLLAGEGYDVIGADLSEDMLTMAYNKALSLPAKHRPRFIHQSMQELELPWPVDLAVCLLDSFNYLADPADGEKTVNRVFESLNPGGLFLFDVNTPEKLRAMDGQVWLDETEDSYCVWRTEFDEAEQLCRYGIDLFRRRGTLWERSFEEHLEYAYTDRQIAGFLDAAGFGTVIRLGDRRLEAPGAAEQRVYYAAKK